MRATSLAARARRPRGVLVFGIACGAVLAAPGCNSMDDDERGHARITVIEGETGEVLWRRHLRAETLTVDRFSPADEIAVYGADRCTTADLIRAFEAGTGEERGEPPFEGYPLPESLRVDCEDRQGLGELLGPVRGACLYRQPNELVALEAESGAERFSVRMLPEDFSIPFDEELFVVKPRGAEAEEDAAIERLSLDTGMVVWRFVPSLDQTPVATGAGAVYLAGVGPEVMALALDDGSELWRSDLGCTFVVAVHDKLVCVEHLGAGTCTYEAD